MLKNDECWIMIVCDCVVEYICCVWNFFCLASHECDVYTTLKTDILVCVGNCWRLPSFALETVEWRPAWISSKVAHCLQTFLLLCSHHLQRIWHTDTCTRRLLKTHWRLSYMLRKFESCYYLSCMLSDIIPIRSTTGWSNIYGSYINLLLEVIFMGVE